MEGPLEKVVEECQLLLGLGYSVVTDVNLTEQLDGDRPTREVFGREGAGFQDPGEEEIQGREVGREMRCGLVVSGNTQVSIQLHDTKIAHKEKEKGGRGLE